MLGTEVKPGFEGFFGLVVFKLHGQLNICMILHPILNGYYKKFAILDLNKKL